jgi:hypothetical protein
MRVTVNVDKYYDWVPVPADVTVTDADIKASRVRPAANGGYLMRVTKTADTHTTCSIDEDTIIALIIHEAMPQQGSMQLSRKEAIGLLLARNIMPHHAHRSFMKSFEVDDDGPDEAAFKVKVSPYTLAIHEASGQPLIDPSEFDGLLAKYMEKTAPADHVEHLHARFNVKKGAAAPAKAVSK